MTELGLQHTVCKFLFPVNSPLFFFPSLYRRSLTLSDDIPYTFFSGALIRKYMANAVMKVV